MVSLNHYLIFSGILFCIGIYGVLARKNVVLILISIELMLNAVNINLVAFSAYQPVKTATGQIFTIFAIAVGAAEIGVGLAIVLTLFRLRQTIDVDKVDLLKW